MKSKNIGDLEEWVLAAMEQESLPLVELCAILRKAGAGGRAATALEWGEMLLEELAGRSDLPGMLAVIQAVNGFSPSPDEWARKVVDRLAGKIKDRHAQMVLKHAGFTGGLSTDEAMRRLQTLSSLAVGVMCLDNTWGFGVVKRLDDFYQKVTIDFTRKRGHQLSYAYAAETLTLLSNEHLLARNHRNPEEIHTMKQDQPAQLVRLALSSFGPMNVQRLQERLVDETGLVKSGEWKPFWDAARRELKDDSLVQIPGKRNDPIVLLEQAREYGEDWFKRLSGERDPQEILRRCRETVQEGCRRPLSPAEQDIAGERLAFALLGVRGNHEGLGVQLYFAAEDLGVAVDAEAPNRVNRTAVLERYLQQDILPIVLSELPVRDLRRLLETLGERDPDRLVEVLLTVLNDLPLTAVGESLAYMIRTSRESSMTPVLKELTGTRTASASLLAWMARNLEEITQWSVLTPGDLALQVVDILCEPRTGEELRSQNQLRKLLEGRMWLPRVLKEMEHWQQVELLQRVNNARVWDTSSRRSVLARIIKAVPELERVLAGTTEDSVPVAEGRYTSWRSYRERQRQHKELVEIQIPANSRDIAQARSYGDLRENFEYQAAKDQQGLLMRRKTEMENDLALVHGSDFKGFKADCAGPGTIVEVVRPGGSQERYVILGEWDRDEALGIIASRSQLAECLAGHGSGDKVVLPDDPPGQGSRIEHVTGLTEEILVWAAGGRDAE